MLEAAQGTHGSFNTRFRATPAALATYATPFRNGSERRKIYPSVALFRSCIEVVCGELRVRPNLPDEALSVRDRQLISRS